MIFDTHTHYDDISFDIDREELLSGLLEKGVGTVVNVGAAARSIPLILELAGKYDFIYAAAGLHPGEVYGCAGNIGEPVMKTADNSCGIFDNKAMAEALAAYGLQNKASFTPELIDSSWIASDRELELVAAALTEPKTVAVGEIGLDYHYEDTRKDIQKEWFARQIALARDVKKPVIVHSRDAAADTLDMIRSEGAAEVGGIIHCFSYGREMAREYLDMGFMLGIGGVVTYKNAKKVKEVVAFMPARQLVLETDCPYLCPEPFRGKRNDSSMLKYVVQVIAQIKGMDEGQLIEITSENARRVYGIKEEKASPDAV